MVNPFITSAKKLIYRNGIDITFVTVTEGVYNSDTGSVTNTEVETTVKAYPKNVTVNQYNFPNLIGKSVVEYLVVSPDLPEVPSPNDKIKVGTSVQTIVAVKDIIARNESVVYIITAVKG